MITGINGLNGFRPSLYISSLNQNITNIPADAASVQAASEENVSKEDVKELNKAPSKSDPNNFTFDFKKSNSFNLVGATSKSEDIDIEKEMSDMKKDMILDQYKYFVNPSSLGTDEDGTVRIKVK